MICEIEISFVENSWNRQVDKNENSSASNFCGRDLRHNDQVKNFIIKKNSTNDNTIGFPFSIP